LADELRVINEKSTVNRYFLNESNGIGKYLFHRKIHFEVKMKMHFSFRPFSTDETRMILILFFFAKRNKEKNRKRRKRERRGAK